MNTYRVDRVNSRRVPCGMNSLRYLGDNANTAHKGFDQLEPGLDYWNQPNLAYGVIFSVWNGEDYWNQPNLAYGVIFSVWNGEDYVIKREKWLDACNLGSPNVKERV